MYCPHCGKDNQQSRYCSACGGLLGSTETPGHPSIQNKVDVTVNVGAPVVLSNKGRGLSIVPVKAAPSPQVEWHRHPAVIVAALVLFFPVGLALMWKYAPWSDNTKWAVSGLCFWPIWGIVVWKQRWSQRVRIGVIAAISATFALAFTPLSPIAVVAALGVFIWVLVAGSKTRAPEPIEVTGSREHIQHTLAACHDIIEGIEGGVDLEMAAIQGGVREQYVRGLEVRQEAYDLLEKAISHNEIATADQKASQALDMLRATRDTVSARAV